MVMGGVPPFCLGTQRRLDWAVKDSEYSYSRLSIYLGSPFFIFMQNYTLVLRIMTELLEHSPGRTSENSPQGKGGFFIR